MSKFKTGKSRMNATDALVAATSVASIIAHVSDMMQFIPARAAASVVLVILQTVQQIDTNKVACYRLARRSAKILVDLKVRMTGRWDSAPNALLENIQEFEQVLVCIRDFMQELRKVSWMGRLLKKGSIEEALNDFHALLDEAERTFQIASLVEIHYTVGVLERRSAGKNVTYAEPVTCKSPSEDATPEPIPSYSETCDSFRNGILSKLDGKKDMSVPVPSIGYEEDPQTKNKNDIEELQLQEELKELESFGFKRYHQADLHLLCEIKSGKSNSFWKDIMVADACGSKVLVKRYVGTGTGDKNNVKEWLRDIKMLRNFHHPNLPQLTGYSDEKSPQPFILLAQAKLRDPSAYFLNALRRMSISESAISALRIYRDISSAALYIQRQLSFDERQTQAFISEASYALDTATGKIVVGIPSLKENRFIGFGYPLTESLLGKTMQILPGEKSLTGGLSSNVVDLRDKLAHIRALAHILLPCLDQNPELSSIAEAFIEDSNFECGESPVPLWQIRRQTISAGMHEFSWHAGIHSCPHSFTVGDIGYISRDRGRVSLTDKSRFDHFVRVGNFMGDLAELSSGKEVSAPLSIIREVSGSYGQWINGFHKTEEAYPFVLPEDVEGWPVPISAGTEIEVHVRHTARMASVSEAWRCLLRQAVDRAAKAGIEPGELILITKTVSGQIYRVHDWSPARPQLFQRPAPFTHCTPQFPHASSHQQLPRILYLFTSFREDFAPCLADSPSASIVARGHPALRNVSLGTAWRNPEAFIGYIQLSAEDFVPCR